MAASLSIAHVTPYPWEDEHEVNVFVRRVAEELAGRGHRLLIVAPSSSQELVRASRKAIHAGEAEPPGGEPQVLAVGEALPPLPGRRRAALPIDVTRTITELFEGTALDLVHVHEPFAPSVASAALRHSRALNVGTFHAPTERVLATQVARKVVQLVFGRLDARTASFAATAELLARFFPGDYRVVAPGADALHREHASGRVTIGFVEHEERAALRLFLRAVRRLDVELPWDVVVHSVRGPSSSTPLRADLQERVRWVDSEDEVLGAADIVVGASDGAMPAPALLLRAQAAGAVPVASRLARLRGRAAPRGGRTALRDPRRRHARRPDRPPAERRRPARPPARPPRRRARGARWPTSWKASTPRWPPGATRPRATRGSRRA